MQRGRACSGQIGGEGSLRALVRLRGRYVGVRGRVDGASETIRMWSCGNSTSLGVYVHPVSTTWPYPSPPSSRVRMAHFFCGGAAAAAKQLDMHQDVSEPTIVAVPESYTMYLLAGQRQPAGPKSMCLRRKSTHVDADCGSTCSGPRRSRRVYTCRHWWV